jgi:hypothetical protein
LRHSPATQVFCASQVTLTKLDEHGTAGVA